MPEALTGVDTIVVGAGSAGLMAGRELKRAGRSVLILEASARAGGRIRTTHTPAGVPIELGAEFVHGEAPETVKLLNEAGIATVNVIGDHYRSRNGKLAIQNDVWKEMKQVFRHMNPDRKVDRSFQDFLDTEPGGPKLGPERTLAAGFVRGFMAADTNLISEKSLSAQGDPTEGAAQARRIVSGYGSLIDFLSREVSDSLLTDTRVKRIVRAESGVIVHDDRGGQFRAQSVIVTVPLPILQNDAISFEPDIPEIRAAAQKLVMGHVARVVIVTKERFWDELRPNIAFVHSPLKCFNAWWTQSPILSPVFIGWSGGPPALDLLDAGDVENAALRELAELFGMRQKTVDKLVLSVHTHNWTADPFILGAYSYTGVGGMNAPKKLSRPIDGRIFFAGEATDAESSGTVEAALKSGKRAAKQVTSLTPARISTADRSKGA